MDSMNNRAIREYAPNEGQIDAESATGAQAQEWATVGSGSTGLGDGPGAPISQAPPLTSPTGSRGGSAEAGSDIGTMDTPPKSTKRKKQSSGMTEQAGQKAEAGMQMSADGLKKAADMTRSMTEDHSGAMGTIGGQAADVMEKGAGYLEHGDTERMIQDLEAMVRRRPMESLLVAAGAGFLLSKVMR